VADLNFIKTNAIEIHNEIMTELENGVSEPLFPGDERRIFGEALTLLFVAMYNAVNDAARQKMLRYARGEVLDAIGENRGIDRFQPVPANTIMRFSVNTPVSENIIILAGTRVTGDFVRYFATDQTAVLMAGAYYVDIDATSIGGGDDYNNIPVGEINVLVDLSNAPLIDSVENITITSGGADQESDEAYRDRIRAAPDRLSTAGPERAYRYWAISADPIISDAVVESPEPGVVLITPIGYGGVLPDENNKMLEKVLATCGADDIRVLTDEVRVQAPSVLLFDIELVYYTTAANESLVVETVEGSGGAIDRFIFWQGSSLNRDLNPDQLRRFILAPDWGEGLVGADRVEIISPVFTQLNTTTVAKFSGNLTVSHEVRG
jgi:phage-related baseplate assembly protein